MEAKRASRSITLPQLVMVTNRIFKCHKEHILINLFVDFMACFRAFAL
jgi:hypothetical protein